MYELEELEKVIPHKINDYHLLRVNELLNDPDRIEEYKENVYTYSHILKENKCHVFVYISAIKYATLKMSGLTSFDAYNSVFPERIERFRREGKSSKDIHSMISSYHRTKVVTKILELAYVPHWLINQGMYNEALETQAQLMRTAKSDKVKSDAANSILHHLRPPEENKLAIDIKVEKSSELEELNNTLRELAIEQRKLTLNKVKPLKLIAESKILTQKSEDE